MIVSGRLQNDQCASRALATHHVSVGNPPLTNDQGVGEREICRLWGRRLGIIWRWIRVLEERLVNSRAGWKDLNNVCFNLALLLGVLCGLYSGHDYDFTWCINILCRYIRYTVEEGIEELRVYLVKSC